MFIKGKGMRELKYFIEISAKFFLIFPLKYTLFFTKSQILKIWVTWFFFGERVGGGLRVRNRGTGSG